MTFELEFTESALEDLKFFKKFEQNFILDAIGRQLLHEPEKETRQRKQLQPNPISEWELRVGVYRVFYDVIASTSVKIKALGWKEHNQVYIRGKEYEI